MDFWNTRTKSLKWLDEDFPLVRDLIYSGYDLQDICIDILEGYASVDDDSQTSKFARVVCSVVVKSKNLSRSCLSLTLDGLSQEAGAILRPLVEAFELMTYLRLDIERADLALNGKLPSAGKIAKIIEGFHINARTHLNNYSSHFSFSNHALKHLYNFDASKFKRHPTQDKKIMLENLKLINAYQIFICMESLSCLHAIGCDIDDMERTAIRYRDICTSEFKRVLG